MSSQVSRLVEPMQVVLNLPKSAKETYNAIPPDAKLTLVSAFNIFDTFTKEMKWEDFKELLRNRFGSQGARGPEKAN